MPLMRSRPHGILKDPIAMSRTFASIARKSATVLLLGLPGLRPRPRTPAARTRAAPSCPPTSSRQRPNLTRR